jgi:hypothetical protein
LEQDDHPDGEGSLDELSLRASVACLIKVLFKKQDDGRRILALERVATLRQIKGKDKVTVTAKPFGGAVRLINPHALRILIGNFQYDSKRSRRERDFRILIKPESWGKLKDICFEHLKNPEKGILNTNPERELTEEFEDTIHVSISRDQYQIFHRGISFEAMPVETDNVRATGIPTVRIYFLYEAWITDPIIINRILTNSAQYTDEDLQIQAQYDVQHGGKGRANATLTLKHDDLIELYRSLNPGMRDELIYFEGHLIEDNVLAILDEVNQTRYEHFNG